MKKLVISLLRRTDRKRNFQKNGLTDYEWIRAVDGNDNIFRDCRADPKWTNPFTGRKLLQNEVACFKSHINAWIKVSESNQPMIIMEDDAVINELWNEDLYLDLMKEYDFLYLQRNENEPENVTSIDNVLEVPSFPYNMTAYVITPKTARHLLSKVDLFNMIPVDDFVPSLIKPGTLKFAAFKEDHCNQLSRDSWAGTDIDQSQEFRNFKIHVVTIGDDRKRCNKLNTSAREYGIDITNIGMNVEWKGTDMSGPGGGMKFNLLKNYIQDLHDNDVLLFTDAFDVFYADNISTIYERYQQLSAKVIFSAELFCWPDSSMMGVHPDSHTEYKYLNSGTFMAEIGELKKIMSNRSIKDSDDDQLTFQEILFIDGGWEKYDVKLDHECYLFQTHEPDVQVLDNGQLWNPKTKCCPCIYHGNGGGEAKEKFDDLYKQIHPKKEVLFGSRSNKVEILSPDMLLVDFMTQDQCEDLIAIADKHGGWGSLSYDKFPAQEIRLSELKCLDQLQKVWDESIVPIVENYWQPLQMYGLRDAFVMRYALDTQTTLNLHHDASLVTGSVKLNDDYLGAELVYPRQGITNKDIPVGKMILFPGQVTHGHECLPLTQGVKYSLTIWTCRYVNDTI